MGGESVVARLVKLSMQPSPQRHLHGYSILLSEQDPLICWDAEETLKSAGAAVIVAATPLAALREADRSSLSAAVLGDITDEALTEPLCRKLEGRNLPFVFYTRRAAAPRLVPVVQKPADPEKLIGAVKFAIAEGSERSGQTLLAPAAQNNTLSEIARYILEGEARIERVQRIVRKLSERGCDTSAADGLIRAMEYSLKLFRDRQRSLTIAAWKPDET